MQSCLGVLYIFFGRLGKEQKMVLFAVAVNDHCYNLTSSHSRFTGLDIHPTFLRRSIPIVQMFFVGTLF
jgi:hypothetical protein